MFLSSIHLQGRLNLIRNYRSLVWPYNIEFRREDTIVQKLEGTVYPSHIPSQWVRAELRRTSFESLLLFRPQFRQLREPREQ